jgi:hypothetical protein
MSETRITNDGTDVIYKMPPYVADELAAILQRAATSGRSPGKWDRGWLQDATSLIEASNVITDPPGDPEQ